MLDKLYLNKKEEEKNISRAEIVFGVLGKNCAGFGICKVIEYNSSLCNCPSVYTEIEKIEDTQLKFIFFIGEISPSLWSKYFGNNTFLLEESFLLPDFLCAKFLLDKKIIEQGSYHIHPTNIGWEIIFRLK